MPVPMEEALTPDECNRVSTFLRGLVMAADDYNVPVGKFIAAYRINVNGYHHKFSKEYHERFDDRRVKAYELRRTTKLSYEAIGKIVGLGRATVSECCRNIEKPDKDRVG